MLPYCFNLRSLQSSSSGISQLSAVHKESFVFRVYLVSAFFFFQAETVAIFVTDVLLVSEQLEEYSILSCAAGNLWYIGATDLQYLAQRT